MTVLTVATVNVECVLTRAAAGRVVGQVLDRRPDLAALQEWTANRRLVLRGVSPAYRWREPLVGDCAVGWRVSRCTVTGREQRWLSPPGGAERSDHWLRLEPPRRASVVTCRIAGVRAPVSLVSFHLVPGVQALGKYRPDRPVLASRHRGEVAALGRWVAALMAGGHLVFAAGDTNFHGLALPGLQSVWAGRPGIPTLGNRQVDDIFSLMPAMSVETIATASDHRAVVASYDLP